MSGCPFFHAPFKNRYEYKKHDALKNVYDRYADFREIEAFYQHLKHTQKRVDEREQIVAPNRFDKTVLHVLDDKMLQVEIRSLSYEQRFNAERNRGFVKAFCGGDKAPDRNDDRGSRERYDPRFAEL